MTTGLTGCPPRSAWARQRVGEPEIRHRLHVPAHRPPDRRMLTSGTRRPSGDRPAGGPGGRRALPADDEFEQSPERRSWSSTGRRKKGRTCSSSRKCCTSTCPSSPPTSSSGSAASTGGANCRPGALGDLPGSLPARPRAPGRLDDDAQRRVRRVHRPRPRPCSTSWRTWRREFFRTAVSRDLRRSAEAHAGPDRAAGDRASAG